MLQLLDYEEFLQSAAVEDQRIAPVSRSLSLNALLLFFMLESPERSIRTVYVLLFSRLYLLSEFNLQ